MKKYHFILFLLLGIFFIPDNGYACGKNSNRSCTKERSKTEKAKENCCSDNQKHNQKHNGCGGKCGHSECGCSSNCPTSSVSFLSEINFKNKMFSDSSIGKVKFLYTTPSISDGYYSIWLIPKIS